MNTFPENAEINGLRIVIAEDDPTVRKLAAKWLSAMGHQVWQACDGREAQAVVAEVGPDLLITDWEMPHMSGLDLCHALRAESHVQPLYILFLTAKAHPDDVAEALAAGADDFLTKPITAEEMQARVCQVQHHLTQNRDNLTEAMNDPLTGLATRRGFEERCQLEIDRAKRYSQTLSCVALDVDLFKSINDTYGHGTGDLVLKAIAEMAIKGCRNVDLVCRMGGDEFCLLLPYANEEQAAICAERVRHAVGNTTIAAGDRQVQPRITAGVAQWHADVTTPQGLLDLADQALLAAKHMGRNRVQRYSRLTSEEMMTSLEQNIYRRRLLSAQAADIMTTPIVCLSKHSIAREAADLFLRLRINSIPVVDECGHLAGIVSEHDLLGQCILEGTWNLPISRIMTANVVCYERDTPVITIWEFMRRVTIRRVVIVENGAPLGVISRGTILRWLGNWNEGKGSSSEWPLQKTDNPDAVFSKTVSLLEEEISKLQQNVPKLTSEFVPMIVDRVTRSQEYLQDLLALTQVCCRFSPDSCPPLLSQFKTTM